MTNEAIKIEKGIPLPVSGRKGMSKYPLSKMEVGDSFFVPALDNLLARKLQSSINSSARSYTQKGKRFSSSVVDGGVRVWRTA